MSVKIACPNPDCEATYRITEENLGRVGCCKNCGLRFRLAAPTLAETPIGSETEFDSRPGTGPPIGTDLPPQFGRYKVIRLLGRGGMGAVYLAHDHQLDRPVALKVPHSEFAQNANVRARFLREARAAARFQHPTFCPIHDIGEVDGIPYLTMAYIEGQTLADSIDRDKPWNPRRAAELVRLLAVALAEAHRQGVIHRDLKPANVMIDIRGRLVIMDFGLARRFEGDNPALTATEIGSGTPAYMPPEQAEGNLKAIGPRSDLYCLGVIFYELLTGRPPFQGPITKILGMIAFVEPSPPSTLRPGLDPRLEAICLKAMAKKPDDRHASMDEFARELTAFLNEPVAPSPVVLRKQAEKQAAQVFAEVVGQMPTSLRDDSLPAEPMPEELEDASKPYRSRVRLLIAAALGVLFLGVIYVAIDKSKKVDDPSPDAVVYRDNNPPSNVDPEPAAPKEESPTEPKAPEVAKVDPPTSSPSPSKPAEVSKDDEALITNTVGMKLKLIPAGEFLMGSGEADSGDEDEKVEGKKHLVRITKPFYLGTTEVTVGQFRKFVEKSGYKTDAEKDGKVGYGWNEAKGTFDQDPKYLWRSPGFWQSDNHPVVNVSWNDAMAFCEWLGHQERETYRLPTEAEWEYCCRAGQETRYSSGNDPELLVGVGNVADGMAKEKFPYWTQAINSRDGFIFTAPVGRFRPNQFGLFDMHGNVWEWCGDWYVSEFYSKSPVSDPLSSSPAATRVYRGGSWYGVAKYCRSAERGDAPPTYRNYDQGFRVARLRSGQSSK